MKLQVLNQGKNAFENFYFDNERDLNKVEVEVNKQRNLFRIIHKSHLAIVFFLHLPFYAVLEG